MLKRALIYVVLSVIVVLFSEYVRVVMVYLMMLYTHTILLLTPLIHTSSASAPLIRTVITLTLLPISIVGIPAVLHHLIKHKPMPFFTESVWLVWLIFVLSKVLVH